MLGSSLVWGHGSKKGDLSSHGIFPVMKFPPGNVNVRLICLYRCYYNNLDGKGRRGRMGNACLRELQVLCSLIVHIKYKV